MNIGRRSVLLWMLGGGLIGSSMVPAWMRKSWAMGSKEYPQGMQTVEGEVSINGIPAEVGSLVEIGDIITTGENGYAIFVMGRSAFMVRGNSRIEMTSQPDPGKKDKIVHILTMINGSMLSVFGKGKRRMITSTATIGIRGTAVYIESEPDQSYVCTCYGRIDLESRVDKSVREVIRTTYHDKPRWVYGKGSEAIFDHAPVINHTDDELILLESLVGRRPPFVNMRGDRENNGGGGY